MDSPKKENNSVKALQFYGALSAMLSLLLLLFLLGEATPDKNVIDVTFDEEAQLTTFTSALEAFHREQKRNRVLLTVMVGVGAAGAVVAFLSAEKVKKQQRAAANEQTESVPKTDVDEKTRRKKEDELRRLYDAGLLDRKEFHARWNALREEDKP